MTIFIIVTAFVIFLIGLAKGGLGGTIGILATPLMALVMPATQVIGLLLPVLLIADLFAITAHWKKWNTKLVLLLIPGALLGVIVGTFFLTSISPVALRNFIGIVALLFVGYKLFETRILNSFEYKPHNWHGLLAGGFSAFSSTLAHSGPPPITMYLMMQNVSPRVFVATSALFFTMLNWMKVPSYYMAGLVNFNTLAQIIWLLPLLPLGVWAGKWLTTKVDKVVFDRIIIAVLAMSGILLLVR